MTRQSYHRYLRSGEWHIRREMIKSRDQYRCRLCHSTEDLCVHHATYNNVGHEEDIDLITLCRVCHEKFHNIASPDQPGLFPTIQFESNLLASLMGKDEH